MKKFIYIFVVTMILIYSNESFAQVLLAPAQQRAIDADNERIREDDTIECQKGQADLPDAQKQLATDQAALAQAQAVDSQANPVQSQPSQQGI